MRLTEFLLARIAEDETDGPRHPDWCRAVADDQACDCDGPARILAECEAKRRIVQEYSERDADVDLMLGPNTLRQREWSGLRLALRYLALPYADHPDYREEWKP